MKKREKIRILAAVICGGLLCPFRADAEAYSQFWQQDEAGSWYVQRPDGSRVKNAWLCDDAVAANGKDVWYLLDAYGNMLTAGLVQDATGNYYSLETGHNGYYGMLRYKSGDYGGVNLNLDGSHNGSFAAVLNADGIEALKAQYGVTSCAHINNGNIVYTSDFGKASGGGGSSAVSTGSTAAGSDSAASAGMVSGGPNRIVPTNGVRQGSYTITAALWGSLMNMTPEEIKQDYWKSPNKKVYYYSFNDRTKSVEKNTSGYRYEYAYNGEKFLCGTATPSNGGNEAGEWITDPSKPDSMYGKTNLRFRYPDGTYAGLGWHSCNMSDSYNEERRELRDSGDPDFLRYSEKWSQCFTEDGYMLRNTDIFCEFCWQGFSSKAGYDGSWLDGPQY